MNAETRSSQRIEGSTVTHNCALIAVISSNRFAGAQALPDWRTSIYRGLTAMQHRGQEAAGVAIIGDEGIQKIKRKGLVSGVFSDALAEESFQENPTIVIGHTRYSTAGNKGEGARDAQPFVFNDGEFVIAHNGTAYPDMSILSSDDPTSDTYAVGKHIALDKLDDEGNPLTFEQRVIRSIQNLEGAYTFIVAHKDGSLYVARDPAGFRPARLAHFGDDGLVVASESVAFDKIGASPFQNGQHELPRGTLMRIWPRATQLIWTDPRTKEQADARCSFESAYFADATSKTNIPSGSGESRHPNEIPNQIIRMALGRRLAERARPTGDIIVPVPESGRPYGDGASEALGIPTEQAIHVNRFVGRNFISPGNASERVQSANLKFNFVPELIQGKRLILTDDSLVRASTMQGIMLQLFDLGAKDIHLLVGIPPITNPCYWGIDFKNPNELIFNVLMNDPNLSGPFEDRLAAYLVDGRPDLTKRVQISFQQIEDYQEIVGNGCYHCVTGEVPGGVPLPFPKKKS